MALAVERAAVILICMSQKYKDSPNCRTGENILATIKVESDIASNKNSFFLVFGVCLTQLKHQSA